MKFGKGMADKGGRAMKNRTADKMGRAMVKKMAGGGMAYKPRPEYLPEEAAPIVPEARMRGVREGMSGGRRMAKGGKVKMSGGSASKRADGVAHKGKTKGKMVKMAYGGKC